MIEETAGQHEWIEMLNQQQHEGIVTLVLTADNHLGSTAFSQHSGKQEERKQRLRQAFQQAADFAIAQGVDLFVQAGDLFDSTTPDEIERSFVAERLAQLKQAGIQAVAIGGVHDTPGEGQSFTLGQRKVSTPAPQVSYARLGALHYLSSPREGSGQLVEPVMLNLRGTLIGLCGLSIQAGQEGDPLEHFRVQDDIERAMIRLLILHAPIEGLISGSSLLDTRAQVSRNSIARQTAFQCILAGYHHSYSRSRIGSTEVIVAGATQHSDFSGADHAPGFVFLGLGKDGVRWCNHIVVDAMPLRRLVIQTNELWPDDSAPAPLQKDNHNHKNDDALASPASNAPASRQTELIIERLRPLCSPDAMLQLKLAGELTRGQYHQLDLNRIRRYGEEHCFALAIDDSALTFRLEQEQSTTGAEERFSPREELVALVDEWIAARDDEQERRALQATKEELLMVMDEVKRRV